MNLTILKESDLPLIEPIVREEMGFMPPQSTYPALYDEGELVGFVRVEHLYHFATVNVMPQYRGRRDIALKLIRGAVGAIPRGHAAICLPDPRQEDLIRLAKRMGARQLLSRVVLRKDVF